MEKENTDNLASQLRCWAAIYNKESFIKDDPVQFPHRFEQKQDIEISAFLSAWIAYGKRSQIIMKAEELHSYMGSSPYSFIRGGESSFAPLREKAARPGSRNTFYRFYTYADLLSLCLRLKEIYDEFDSLEDALSGLPPASPIGKLQFLFRGIKGIPSPEGKSACKRLAMFLRWMVRDDGIVDFGIWKTAVKPAELIIPLDTHVYQIATRLGLTSRKTADKEAALEITTAMSVYFPGDPCLADFALFGYDINNKGL